MVTALPYGCAVFFALVGLDCSVVCLLGVRRVLLQKWEGNLYGQGGEEEGVDNADFYRDDHSV